MKPCDMLAQEAKTLPVGIAARTDAKEVAIVFGFDNGDYHTISPDNDVVARGLIEAAAGTVGAGSALTKTAKVVDLPQAAEAAPALPAEVIFKNRQAIGDILCMTAAVRDFKAAYPDIRVGVRTTAMHLWDHNPHIDHTFADDSKIKDIGPGFGTNRSNAWNIHLIDAFRLDIENKLACHIQKGAVTPDIWMTQAEYQRPPLIDGAYWVIIVGGEPGWTAKQYHRWQEVVDALQGKVQFVQLGVSRQPWPKLNGVIDFIGRTEDKNTGLRDLFNIFLHAQGSLGLVSMHMHLMAAFGGPCVVLAGAREPAWFTHYFGHQYLETNGCLPCGAHSACWKCDVKGCKSIVDAPKGRVLDLPVPRCVDIIEPEEVAAAVLRYYRGGRLEFGKKIPNTFFKNITKEAKQFVVPKATTSDEDALVEQLGFKWGGGSLTDRDWAFMKKVIKDHNVKTVLEFGAGLSTVLLSRTVEEVLSLETSGGWIKKIHALVDKDKCQVLPWTGKGIGFSTPADVKYDLAFVDGPSGGASREVSTRLASELSDVVIVHDANREAERKWQAMYLEPSFNMVSKGGHRCHLWVRKTAEQQAAKDEAEQLEVRIAPLRTKLARMVTTCRGFGGSERSTISLMQQLLGAGYNVALHPTGKISGEYARNIPKAVRIAGAWETVTGECDLLVMYCSDTIWNFENEQYALMADLKAARKVMVLNYQLGAAGKIAWTRGWDLYMFLNSTKEGEFLKVLPGASTKVLAPSTDLAPFFAIQPQYSNGLRFIRHSSQGDAKHPEYTNQLMQAIWLAAPKAEFHYMPAASFCMDDPRVIKYPKNQPPVPEFLANGNCFLYHLPPGYQDQGPKVLVECAAAGLAAIADNRYGAKDRITPETGWLVNDALEIVEIVREITRDPEILRVKGEAARQRAKEHFVKERWLEAIVGGAV